MAELEMRAYPIGMLSGILGTNGKQATDRKLASYGYGFTSAESTQLPPCLMRSNASNPYACFLLVFLLKQILENSVILCSI